jgi:predicted CopG family antitoxin
MINIKFLEVIMQDFPAKRKLSEVLDEIGRDDDLADRIEAASTEMRKSKMREVNL